MRPADLLRRTPFRLAMTITVLLVATLLLAGGVGFGLMHAQLTNRQDARVTEMYRSLEQAMVEGDERDLIETITSRIAASPDQASIYLLKDQSGQVLASNIAGFAPPDGWSTVPADLQGITTNYPYRVFTGTSGAYTLSVGLTDADLDDLREIMAGSLGWSAVTVLIAALGVGAVLAIRMDRRLTVVDHTMNLVAHGDLTARLDLSGRNDDLDQIANTINGALARLEGVVEAMRQVSADIAHDLRTPLNRLRIRIESAATKAEADQPVAEDLAAALTEADQINETFSALLRIAQIETGSRKAGFQPVNLGNLLGDLAEIYRAVAEDAGQSLTISPSDQTHQINGDPELLTQLFANLIENAIRHCPAGTVITCGLVGTAGRIVASVADTGPGIPLAERENVQRRLYRLEKSRSTPGSGLGLSLVRAIADLHQATLALHDTNAAQGTGLTVEISFSPI
jgi:signal transduction histidine kinase